MKQKLMVNELNLKGEVCPMTFVKTKVQFDIGKPTSTYELFGNYG